ncbi:MAG: phytochelatin synthase [Myxococcales bacterium]|nr:phytochelatin synthase [Myxococcales bacterium]
MTRLRKLLLGRALGLAVTGGGLAVLPSLLWNDGVDYSQAVSIRATREFQDPALLARAFGLPVALLYQRGGTDFQGNGSFCGPTSLVNLRRSQGHAADQATILEGTGRSTWFGLLPGGLTLDEQADVARKATGQKVTLLRDLDLATFRRHVASTNDPSLRYLVNFHRGPLFGRGGGHHSPIAGYLASEDLMLVLDVNKTYRPWLVKTDRLFAAIDTIDPVNKRKRGLLRVE